MGPALIREEIDDSGVLPPGDMFHHIVIYWGRCIQFPWWIHAFKFVTRNTQHCHPTLKNGGDKFHIIYVGGVFVFSQSGRIISTETDERSQTTAEWLLLGVTLTEIDERQRRCLVQRTIDTTTKNCNANYSGFSRFPHGPVVNKSYCPASYVYYVWPCLSLSLGSTVARDLLRESQLSGGRHSPVTLDTMWSQRQRRRSSALMIG